MGVNVGCVEGGEVELHAVGLFTYVRTQVKIITREDNQFIIWFQGVFIERD